MHLSSQQWLGSNRGGASRYDALVSDFLSVARFVISFRSRVEVRDGFAAPVSVNVGKRLGSLQPYS